MAELKAPALPAVADMKAAPSPTAKMNGRQKAAVLLVTLGPERASQLFGHLRDDEIEALTLEMAKLRNVDIDTTEAVIGEAMEMSAAMNYIGSGGFEYARDGLEKSPRAPQAPGIMGPPSPGVRAAPVRVPPPAPP